jgi:hypothetical protein
LSKDLVSSGESRLFAFKVSESAMQAPSRSASQADHLFRRQA